MGSCKYYLKLIFNYFSNFFLKNFRTELEFRGIVFGKKFTCLTQYYDLLYIPYVNEHHKEIENMIYSFWETNLLHLIPLDDYCVDFGLRFIGKYYFLLLDFFN